MPTRQAGYALIMVLWVMMLLTTMAMAFSNNVKLNNRGALSITEGVRLAAAAEGAMHYIAHKLSQNDGADPLVSGQSYTLTWPDTQLEINVKSAAGKININLAPPDLLVGLFRRVLPDAPAEAMAAALLDWRDRDDKRTPQGAEAADYRDAGLTSLPGNRPFVHAGELSKVLGIGTERSAQLAPYVTVYSRSAKIDPYSADATVLSSVPGLDDSVVQQFVAYRAIQLAQNRPIRLDLLQGGIRHLERQPQLDVVNIHVASTNGSGQRYMQDAVLRLVGKQHRYLWLDWQTDTLEAYR